MKTIGGDEVHDLLLIRFRRSETRKPRMDIISGREVVSDTEEYRYVSIKITPCFMTNRMTGREHWKMSSTTFYLRIPLVGRASEQKQCFLRWNHGWNAIDPLLQSWSEHQHFRSRMSRARHRRCISGCIRQPLEFCGNPRVQSSRGVGLRQDMILIRICLQPIHWIMPSSFDLLIFLSVLFVV